MLQTLTSLQRDLNNGRVRYSNGGNVSTADFEYRFNICTVIFSKSDLKLRVCGISWSLNNSSINGLQILLNSKIKFKQYHLYKTRDC